MDQLLLQASLGKRAYLSQRVGRSIASRASALSRAYLTCLDIKPLNAQQTPRVKQDPFRVRAAPQGVNFPFSPWISQVQTQLLQQTGPSGWQLTPVEPSFSLGGGQSGGGTQLPAATLLLCHLLGMFVPIRQKLSPTPALRPGQGRVDLRGVRVWIASLHAPPPTSKNSHMTTPSRR